jgi:hypothetical protein
MDAKTTPSWYRRPGVLFATAAIAAGVTITVLEPSDRDPLKFDAATPRPTWSMKYILVTADPWDPGPETAAPPPAAPAAAVAAPAYNPPPTREYVPAYVPPPPPPPPPPQVTLRFDNPVTAAIVSMANTPSGSSVNCRMTMAALSGPAASIGWHKDNDFALVGTQETRVPAGSANGPATGSSFRTTVTCDNGTSTSLDGVY